MKKPYIIGISGGTCSGKSTIAGKLNDSLCEKYKTAVLNMDDYYNWSKMKTVAPITRVEYPEHNHPDAFDINRFRNDFTAAINDETVDVIITEGLFALYFDCFREQYDLKVYVDLQSDERMFRRIKRMMLRESLDDIAIRYLDTVRYRHNEFVEPTRWYADLVINGSCVDDVGVDLIASYAEKQIDNKNN